MVMKLYLNLKWKVLIMNKILKKMKELIMKQNLSIWNLNKLLMIMNIVSLNQKCIKLKKNNMKIKLVISKEKLEISKDKLMKQIKISNFMEITLINLIMRLEIITKAFHKQMSTFQKIKLTEDLQSPNQLI